MLDQGVQFNKVGSATLDLGMDPLLIDEFPHPPPPHKNKNKQSNKQVAVYRYDGGVACARKIVCPRARLR